MQELSMNILDIAENSVRANATLVEILLTEDPATSRMSLIIRDNGKGMDAETVQRVTDPFYTTRTTRKVGLGLPFLKMAAEMTGGGFSIQSAPGAGTTVEAVFTLGHIDLAPLGDMGGTISALCQGAPDIDFVYTYTKGAQGFTFDTREAREILGGVSFSQPAVALFIRDFVRENMKEAQAPPEPSMNNET